MKAVLRVQVILRSGSSVRLKNANSAGLCRLIRTCFRTEQFFHFLITQAPSLLTVLFKCRASLQTGFLIMVRNNLYYLYILACEACEILQS